MAFEFLCLKMAGVEIPEENGGVIARFDHQKVLGFLSDATLQTWIVSNSSVDMTQDLVSFAGQWFCGATLH